LRRAVECSGTVTAALSDQDEANLLECFDVDLIYLDLIVCV
jgi:hypothetical protein